MLRGPVATPLIGHAVFERLAGHLVHHLAGAVPDFDLLGERPHCVQVGERPVDGGDQEVLAVGRDARRFDDSGLADRRHLAGGQVDDRELRGGVVFEQILVVRILQHVFVGDEPGRAAQALLHVRPGGHRGFGRRRAAIRLDHLDQQRLAVGHPLHVGGSGAAAAASAAAAGRRPSRR